MDKTNSIMQAVVLIFAVVVISSIAIVVISVPKTHATLPFLLPFLP
jgi:hypothetical protein